MQWKWSKSSQEQPIFYQQNIGNFTDGTCKYWPRVQMSTPTLRRSCIVSFTSSSDSPKPSMMDDFVTMQFTLLACFNTAILCSYLPSKAPTIFLQLHNVFLVHGESKWTLDPLRITLIPSSKP
jgi:hypothetical protein